MRRRLGRQPERAEQALHGVGLGHRAHDPARAGTTTLRFYARWLPKEGRRYVELFLGSSAEVPQAVPAPESLTS